MWVSGCGTKDCPEDPCKKYSLDFFEGSSKCRLGFTTLKVIVLGANGSLPCGH